MDLLKAEVERKRKLMEEKELLAVRGMGLPRRVVILGRDRLRRTKFGLFRARDAIKEPFVFTLLAFLGVHGACPTLQGGCY